MKWMGCLALSMVTLACAPVSTKNETSPDGGGGGDAGTPPGEDGGPIANGPVRAACPIDKPQKVYGFALNAKSTLDVEETWTPDNVYLVFGPFHLEKKLTIKAGTVVCFDYGPPGADGSAEPPPG